MRVHVDERPRIESTSTSSTASSFATFGYFAFQRSSPSSAAFLSGEFAMTTSASPSQTASSDLLVDAGAREAIRTALDDTFAVEAAAGTGKTSVLVDRIVNILV